MHALRLIWNKVSTTHTEANGKWIGTLDPLIEPLTSFAIATTKKGLKEFTSVVQHL